MITLAALDGLRDRYLSAQLAGDRREALRLLVEDGLRCGAGVSDLQAGVVQAAQGELGRLWSLNRVTIAQEHMASAISQLALAALFERATPAPRLGKRLLLACVPGEQHDLPARLVADYLDLAGFDMSYLGADVPHDDLVRMACAEQPDVVGLSVTMSFNVPALRTVVGLLGAVLDRPILVGGHAIQWSPGLIAELGVATGGTTSGEVVATARRLARLAP